MIAGTARQSENEPGPTLVAVAGGTVFAALSGSTMANTALLGSTLMNDELELPYAEPDDMAAAVGHAIDGLVDAGAIGIELTTVLDLSADQPVLVRAGKGPVAHIADLA